MAGQQKTEFNILHVEDDEEYTEIVSKILEDSKNYDFKLTPVRSVDDALKEVDEGKKFDLVLVDLKLQGDATGVDFLRNLHDTGRLPNVRKYIVSDLSEENISISGKYISLSELYGLGISKYLTKNILRDAKDVEEMVDVLINIDVDIEHMPVTGLTIFKSFAYFALLSIIIMLLGIVIKQYMIILIGSGGLAMSSILLLVSLKYPEPTHEQRFS